MENTENGSADNGNENEEAGESEVTDYGTDNSETIEDGSENSNIGDSVTEENIGLEKNEYSSGGADYSSGGNSGVAGVSPEPARNVEAKEISQAFITNGKLHS